MSSQLHGRICRITGSALKKTAKCVESTFLTIQELTKLRGVASVVPSSFPQNTHLLPDA